MIDCLLDTVLVEDDDMNSSDIEGEISALFARQQLIDAIVHGESSLEELMELLTDQGHDPEAYLEQVEENLTLYFNSNPVVSGGLFLPLVV
jgi:hypothetical protein